MNLRQLSASCLLLLLAGALSAMGQSPPGPLPAFGIGADSQTARDLTKWIPQMAAIGIPMVRTCEPSQMDYLAARHMQFGGLLYGRPPGDTVDAPGSLPVNDLPAWSAMVTARVTQAHGRVKYWEVWNEPPNGIGHAQTAADYSKIVVATYNAAHAIDPTCLVGLAAKSNDVNWLEQTINAGARDHFDFIILHPYEVLNGVADNLGTEPVFMSIVPTLRKMLAAQDPARAGVPVIFTELGSDAKKGPANQAAALVKAYTMGIAQGVSCIEWFEGMDGDSGPMGLLQRDGTPRPAYTAMAQMIRALGPHPAYLGWLVLGDSDCWFFFKGPAGPVAVVWSFLGNSHQCTLSDPISMLDPITGAAKTGKSVPLSPSPMILTNVPRELINAAAAAANKLKPFPWGGDYTGADNISMITGFAPFKRGLYPMFSGSAPYEHGLHTMAGPHIADAVLAYGGSARSGSLPGGNMFIVDPNFLSYTTVPIEITAVVRRNEANDNAGFKLQYESTSGFKSLGWYTIPDNKQWHTVKWKITDDQFVGMYGFNFTFNSDGDRYNKYLIQSVTVSKPDPGW